LKSPYKEQKGKKGSKMKCRALLVYESNDEKNGKTGNLLMLYSKSSNHTGGLREKVSLNGLGEQKNWGSAPSASEIQLYRGIFLGSRIGRQQHNIECIGGEQSTPETTGKGGVRRELGGEPSCF
jgi:hypothetical protein